MTKEVLTKIFTISLLAIALSSVALGKIFTIPDLSSCGMTLFGCVLTYYIMARKNGDVSMTKLLIVSIFGASLGFASCAGLPCKMDTTCAVNAASKCLNEMSKCCIYQDAGVDP